MKKVAPFALIVFCLAFVLSSCEKRYEDGPAISFTPRKARVVNTWAVKNVYQDGKDVTEDYRTGVLDIMDDGTFKAYSTDTVLDTTYIQNGLWDLMENDNFLRLLYTDPIVNPDRAWWEILKLKSDELWVQDDRDTTVLEFRFITK